MVAPCPVLEAIACVQSPGLGVVYGTHAML